MKTDHAPRDTTQTSAPSDDITVYETSNGEIRVDVRLGQDTVWLSLNQLCELFGRDKSVISRHLNNIFKSHELERTATVANIATVQTEGQRQVSRDIEHFNLDAILSVGYRVNSKSGTQFRIWASQVLKDHLLRGYTLNQQRLAQQGVTELEQALELLQRTLSAQLSPEQSLAGVEVVRRYVKTFAWLLAYDESRLPDAPRYPVLPKAEFGITAARAAIGRLRDALATRGEATGLFGLERTDGLAGILGGLEQTFGGQALYESVQSRAAHLLYFVIKDHPFADGNKRIGALLFLEYLHLNGLLLQDGLPRLDDKSMAALTLFIAESQPAQKELMVRLVLGLLEDA